VDDQRDIRSIATLGLGKLGGYTLLTCESGAEALAQVAAFAPDLLLLDFTMPGMDGIATLGALRAQGVTAPAIFFTSKTEAEDRARYLAAGAIGTIPKPFDPLKLRTQVQHLWNTRDVPAT
jgi:two-component system OmpR family response regulator